MMAFTGRLRLGFWTTVQTGLGAVLQLVSTGGEAALGDSTVTPSDPLLKTSNWLPVEFETTICALGTAIVVRNPAVKFITSIAPTKEKPGTVADGTAANATAEEVGMIRLIVGPWSRTLPRAVSLAVLT